MNPPIWTFSVEEPVKVNDIVLSKGRIMFIVNAIVLGAQKASSFDKRAKLHPFIRSSQGLFY